MALALVHRCDYKLSKSLKRNKNIEVTINTKD